MTAIGVTAPELRARLAEAVASFGNEEFQERLWHRGERLNNYELGFDDTILVVIDELESARPTELIGYVLRDDAELAAFKRLSEALNHLVRGIGSSGTFDDALAIGAPWHEVVVSARLLDSLLGG